MTDSNELKQGTLILKGNQQINVSVNYEKHYFLCPFCGNPVTFKKYDEKFKKIFSNCTKMCLLQSHIQRNNFMINKKSPGALTPRGSCRRCTTII